MHLCLLQRFKLGQPQGQFPIATYRYADREYYYQHVLLLYGWILKL